jgi:P-type E1-E2 ATPase
VNDATIRVGSARYLESIGIGSGQLSGLAEVAETAGETPIFVARDDQLIGGLAIADPVRADAKRTVSELQAQGLGVAMVSGDREGTARAIARSLGIDDVVAEVLPDEKVAAITALRGRYGSVAFVGDGINDAPALAAADVGIAIGSGTDVAIESADVVLASGQTGGVVRAIAVSRATLRNLRQNLFWAFAYNVALIPIAAGILYPFGGPLLSPVLAAGAMSLSSVFVVTNALRLRIAAAPTGDAGSAAAPLQAVQAE